MTTNPDEQSQAEREAYLKQEIIDLASTTIRSFMQATVSDNPDAALAPSTAAINQMSEMFGTELTVPQIFSFFQLAAKDLNRSFQNYYATADYEGQNEESNIADHVKLFTAVTIEDSTAGARRANIRTRIECRADTAKQRSLARRIHQR